MNSLRKLLIEGVYLDYIALHYYIIGKGFEYCSKTNAKTYKNKSKLAGTLFYNTCPTMYR